MQAAPFLDAQQWLSRRANSSCAAAGDNSDTIVACKASFHIAFSEQYQSASGQPRSWAGARSGDAVFIEFAAGDEACATPRATIVTQIDVNVRSVPLDAGGGSVMIELAGSGGGAWALDTAQLSKLIASPAVHTAAAAASAVASPAVHSAAAAASANPSESQLLVRASAASVAAAASTSGQRRAPEYVSLVWPHVTLNLSPLDAAAASAAAPNAPRAASADDLGRLAALLAALHAARPRQAAAASPPAPADATAALAAAARFGEGAACEAQVLRLLLSSPAPAPPHLLTSLAHLHAGLTPRAPGTT